MRIEFLWFADCPSHEQAFQRLHQAMESVGVQAEVHSIEVKSHKEAVERRFPGSPTIRINGVDIDPQGAAQNPVGLSCRVYRLPDGRVSPVPTVEMIVTALQQAQRREV